MSDPLLPPLPSYNQPRLPDLVKKLDAAERRIADLEQRLARLSNICGALAEHTDLRDEAFTAAVTAAEKRRAEVFKCTGCGKVLQRGLAKCMYCGAVNAHASHALP